MNKWVYYKQMWDIKKYHAYLYWGKWIDNASADILIKIALTKYRMAI